MDTTKCLHCSSNFKKQKGNKGYKRRSLSAKLPHSTDTVKSALKSHSNLENSFFTSTQPFFLCDDCYNLLGGLIRKHNERNSLEAEFAKRSCHRTVQSVIEKTGNPFSPGKKTPKKTPVNYKIGKRARTPHTTPRETKKKKTYLVS